MSSPYSSRFWKKNWDSGLEDLDPKEFNMTFIEMCEDAFVEYADKMALEFLGVEITFKELDAYLIHRNI
jgi:long-chain acyl-CoA synthetase